MSRHDLDPRKDADILNALGGLGNAPRPGERSDADLVAGAMAGFADPRYAPIEPEPVHPLPYADDSRPSQAPVVIAVAAAALAIAAAVILVVLRPGGLLSQQTGDSAGNLAPDVHDDDAEEFEAVPGKAKKKKRAAPKRGAVAADAPEVDDAVPTGCEQVARGVQVCADEDATVATKASAGAGPATITLSQGRVRVIATPDGASAVVNVGNVRISGRGTTFDATLVLSPGGEGDVLVVVVASGTVTVQRDGETPRRVGPGEPFVLALGGGDAEPEDAPELDDAGDPAPKARPKRKATPNEMLTRAQKLFGAGKTKQAVGVYETLVSRHPSTAAAKAARVSLGRIELGRGRAKQALAHFDAYLAASAGSLVEEARYGRIRALRKLGRASQERRSIDAFLEDYPKSIYAARLTKRAAQLAGK